jgi:hypothetical protein
MIAMHEVLYAILNPGELIRLTPNNTFKNSRKNTITPFLLFCNIAY